MAIGRTGAVRDRVDHTLEQVRESIETYCQAVDRIDRACLRKLTGSQRVAFKRRAILEGKTPRAWSKGLPRELQPKSR